MKKIFSIILCVAILSTFLTGCGVNELGYLNTISEISNLKTFKLLGKYEINTPETIKLKIDGNVDISNPQDMYADAVINLEYPSMDMYLTDAEFIFTNNTLYIEKDIIKSILSSDETAGYLKTFDEELSGIEYITISTEDLSLDDAPIQQTMDIKDEIPEILKEIFNGLETGAITKTNSGYVVEISDKNLIKIIDTFVDFIDNNKEKIYDTVLNALDTHYDMLKGLDLPEKEELFEEINKIYTKDVVCSEISETIKTYKEQAREEIIAELEEFKDSAYTQTLFKNQSQYTIKEDLKINYPIYSYFPDPDTGEMPPVRTETVKFNGVTNIEAVKTINKKAITPENTLDINLAQEKVDAKYTKNYPVVSVQIIWTEPEYGASIYTVNSEHVDSFDYSDIYLKDDRIYLPLRQIAEHFGETVEWDAENSKAYVVRDNEKIDMTGIIIEDRTMIKVRDFEKLGYKIDYNFNGYENVATINR